MAIEGVWAVLLIISYHLKKHTLWASPMDINDIRRTFKNAEQLVASVLKDCPETRENDKLLILKVWELQGLKFTNEQKTLFLSCFSPETIRRERQKIQEGGLFRPSRYKQAERSLFEMEHRAFHRKDKED